MLRKRLLTATIFLVCLSLMILSVSAFSSAWKPGESQSRFTYIAEFGNTFYIQSNGLAVLDSTLETYSSNTLEVEVNLQRYSGGSWQSIKSWSGTSRSTYCSVCNTWYVQSGYQYRMVSYGYVSVSGNLVESTVYTSNPALY